MRIKTVPEEFVVEELANHEVAPGEYVLARLTKTDMTTEHALAAIARFLRIPRRLVACAGTKDRRAVTTQYVTARTTPARLEGFSRPAIALEVLGTVREPLHLGDLSGNRFRIVVRDIGDTRPHELRGVPNYFDEQRFSVANSQIGLHLLRKEYADATGLVAGTDAAHAPGIETRLAAHATDFVGALRLLPRHTLLMYVHAYQSALFNEILSRYTREHDQNAVTLDGPVRIVLGAAPATALPLVGFDDLPEPYAGWYGELLERDGLSQNDFVNRQMPFLTLEGGMRDSFVELWGLSISEPEEGVQTLEFELPPGAYATIVVKCLYRSGVLG